MGERRNGLDWIEMSVTREGLGDTKGEAVPMCMQSTYIVSKVYNAVWWNCLDIMLM